MHIYEVLRRPVITEKGSLLQGQGKYVFEVDTRANKNLVQEAIHKAFNVNVKKVNIMNVHPKRKNFGGHLTPRRAWKKAIITLMPGEKIELFEGT